MTHVPAPPDDFDAFLQLSARVGSDFLLTQGAGGNTSIKSDGITWVKAFEVFRAIGASIAANTDGDQRAIIRRSPLPPAAIAELQTWLTENLPALRAAAADNQLLDEIALAALSASRLSDLP